MVRPNMRTSDAQPIVSRPAKAKHSLKSKLCDYSSNKAPVSIPRYVVSMYPGADLPTKRAMVNAVERYLQSPDGVRYGMPSPTQCKILFEGLI